MELNIWTALETGTHAIASVWRKRVGAPFDLFNRAFLQSRPEPARSFPCDRCGCAHEITIHAPEDIVAVCNCDPWDCDDLILAPADLEILELNWPKLARALCQAFSLDARPAELPFSNTRQIGSWSANAVPVILTIQHERPDFQHVVLGLAARLREKFILLAPTSDNMDATSQEILANAGAGFFALDQHIRLTEHGALRCRRTPSDLFGAFIPKDPVPEEVARQAFALIRALDSETGLGPAPAYTVFRLYCMEGLSAERVAQQCRCSKGTIINRLRMIRKKTGTDPDKLRAYSSQFESMEESLADSRAKRVYRKGAAYGDEGSEESGDY